MSIQHGIYEELERVGVFSGVETHKLGYLREKIPDDKKLFFAFAVHFQAFIDRGEHIAV